MFGGKKIKEAQIRVEELETVQKEYRQLSDDMRKTKAFSDEMFAVLNAGDKQLDQGLKGVADLMKNEKENSEALLGQASALFTRFEEIEEKNSRIQTEKGQWKQAFEEGRKSAELIREVKELCGKISVQEQEKAVRREETLEQSLEKLTKMQDAAKNMTVLALNAAIEAGRLGESGMRFLQAAENVRQLSEEYGRMVSELSSQMKELQEIGGREALTETVNQMSQKTEEADQAAEWFRENESVVREDTSLTELLQEQKNTAEDLKDGIKERSEVCQKALDQIEFIEQSSMEDRKAKEELKEQLSRIYEQLI